MTDAPRSKGTDSPMCKLCGHRHRFADPHIFGKAAPTLKDVRDMTAKLERAFPSPNSSPSPSARATRSDKGEGAKLSANRAAPSPKAAATPMPMKAETIKALGALVDGTVAKMKAKPKRKRRMDTPPKPKRGRKAGPVPFDKKAHDRKKAAEKRAAKKAAASP